MGMSARIFFTGVGGQGTLTATILLAQAAMRKGLPVTAGEVHGMAQRGGVVESTLLIGGFSSPRIAAGEADVLLGFEPLETLACPAFAVSGKEVSINPHQCTGCMFCLQVTPDIKARKRSA